MTPTNMLISLHPGYGLGDAAQMSAVLRHVAKYRPNWAVDYRAEEGRHQVGRGIVANTFANNHPNPTLRYDAEVQIVLYSTWNGWRDRPNTLTSDVLHRHFDLPWDRECGRQRINVSENAELRIKMTYGKLLERSVAVHYEGTTSQDRKNLTCEQADRICCHIDGLGYTPLLLDWQYRCLLPRHHKLRAPSSWGNDAEMVCGVISQCRAFVGIDSGPSKCASATNTPSLVVWTGHHPAQFHDPSPNTTHLVPSGYHSISPVNNDEGVIAFFEKNYDAHLYRDDPVDQVKVWLSEVLK